MGGHIELLRILLTGLDVVYKDLAIKAGIEDVAKKLYDLYDGDLETLTPTVHDMLNAFRYCPWNKLKIIILGQDPYPKDHTADGLAFSSLRNAEKIQPSFKNIYANLYMHRLAHTKVPPHGNLTQWAEQGVLLLNAALSIDIRGKKSHKVIWGTFIGHVLEEISAKKKNVVFMLWGAEAQEYRGHINEENNLILVWDHPSPIHQYNQNVKNSRHFVHCNHFVVANRWLMSRGIRPIVWELKDDDGNKIDYSKDPNIDIETN